jgi:hypothetical protein
MTLHKITEFYEKLFRVSGSHGVALMMEAVRTSEMSVYNKETTRSYIPEGSEIVPT